MEEENKKKWYFKNWSLVVSFLCVGPFMLPLVWANQHLSKNAKLMITAAIITLTILLVIVSLRSLGVISNLYQEFSI